MWGFFFPRGLFLVATIEKYALFIRICSWTKMRKDNHCLLNVNRNRRYTVSNVTSERRNLVGQLSWVLAFRSVIRLLHPVLRAVTSCKLLRTDMQTRSNSQPPTAEDWTAVNSVAVTTSCVLKNHQILIILYCEFINCQPVYSTHFRVIRGASRSDHVPLISRENEVYLLIWHVIKWTIINSIVTLVHVVIYYKFKPHVSAYCGRHKVYRNTKATGRK